MITLSGGCRGEPLAEGYQDKTRVGSPLRSCVATADRSRTPHEETTWIDGVVTSAGSAFFAVRSSLPIVPEHRGVE